MEDLTARLLNDFQRDFPLSPAPFDQIALSLNTSAAVILKRLQELQVQGTVSRVGPVFRPNSVGASTLAAMAVPAERIEEIAAVVNRFPQVNHNYEREHRYNLWFVATAADQTALSLALQEIEQQAGYAVLSLPLIRDYHIDLGFKMQLTGHVPAQVENVAGKTNLCSAANEPYTGNAEDLIQAIQGGLPLVERPYREIGVRIGLSEEVVIERLREMINAGIIKRLGVVVRHHELGYRANAMVVWNIPDEDIDRVGRALGEVECVTLCYQRPRRLPDWPYNLFCMVHGRDRTAVEDCILDIVETFGLGEIPHATLFSGRRFKQRGARYRLG